MAFPSAQTLRERRQNLKDMGAKYTGKENKPVFLPKNLERQYNKTVQSRVKVIQQVVRDILVPKIPIIVNSYALETGINDSIKRMDTWSDDLNNSIVELQVRVEEEAFQDSSIEEAALVSFGAVNAKSFDVSISAVDKSLGLRGINVFKENRWLASAADAFAEQNVNLIKSIPSQYFGNLQVLIKQEIQKGTATSKIQKAILDSVSFRKTEETIKGFRRINPSRRAALIARDQLNKLYGQLNMLRQTAIGIDKFIWQTAQDERVRASHRPLNGKTFTWKEGANGIFPGSEIQCRCVAIPEWSSFS